MNSSHTPKNCAECDHSEFSIHPSLMLCKLKNHTVVLYGAHRPIWCPIQKYSNKED